MTDLVATVSGSRTLPSNRSRLGLAAFMTVAGITHFAAPEFYESIVPGWAGDPRRVVEVSGVAELLCGAMVAIPRTKRLGAWLTLIVLICVYPANINMAIQAGVPSDAAGWGAWLRLPLQLPMWRWAFRHTRQP